MGLLLPSPKLRKYPKRDTIGHVSVWDPLQPEFQWVVSHLFQVLCMNSKCSQLLSQLSMPLTVSCFQLKKKMKTTKPPCAPLGYITFPNVPLIRPWLIKLKERQLVWEPGFCLDPGESTVGAF